MATDTGSLARELDLVMRQAKHAAAPTQPQPKVQNDSLSARPGDGLRKFARELAAMPEPEVTNADLHAVKIVWEKHGSSFSDFVGSMQSALNSHSQKRASLMPTSEDNASGALRKVASMMAVAEEEILLHRMIKAAHALRAQRGLNLLSEKAKGAK
jgi:hypothetical protein